VSRKVYKETNGKSNLTVSMALKDWYYGPENGPDGPKRSEYGCLDGPDGDDGDDGQDGSDGSDSADWPKGAD
jgi:hypothetical protein